jgi:hypothetical protein
VDQSKQYASMYFIRIAALRKSLLDAAQAKWGSGCEGEVVPSVSVSFTSTDAPPSKRRMLPVISTAKLADGGSEVVLIGTLFKDMPNRPDTIQEYADNVSTDKGLTKHHVTTRC